MKKNYLPLSINRNPLWFFLMLLSMVLPGRNSLAQTILTAGDIAFTGFNSNSNTVLANEFSFVILRSGGIATGTVINFTDNGWNTKLTPAALGTNEGVTTWTTSSALPQFTEVVIKVATTGDLIESVSNGVATISGYFILSQGGDQVLAYQGSSTSPTFIAGIHYNANPGSSNNNPTTEAGWDDLTGGAFPYSFTSSASAIPAGLTSGVNAVWVASGTAAPIDEEDNGIYNCTGSSGATASAIRAAINNRSNWNTADVTAFNLPSGCVFAIGSAATITTQPVDATVCEDDEASFTVIASGATEYQWQVNEGAGFVNLTNTAPYSGTTTATLTITGLSESLSGNQYRVVVSGTIPPSVTSNAATLTINTAPSISSQPENDIICAGTNAAFDVTATNATDYQWQVNEGAGFTDVTDNDVYSGATTSSLTITSVTAALNGNQYRIMVEGACTPTATSDAATLTIISSPEISTQPENSIVCPGENATFSIGASAATDYQWQVNEGTGFTNLTNTTMYSGVNTSTLTINSATDAMDGFQYRAVVSGICDPSVTSSPATLSSTDNIDPVITNCPSDIVLDAADGTCEATATWTAPTAIDNCTLSSFTTDFESGDAFPVGTTTVEYIATDASGNTNSCSFNVSVSDTEDPIFTFCPSDISIDEGVYIYDSPTATDNCSDVTITLTGGLGSGGIFPVGETIETYTAEDVNDNSQTCSFTITATVLTGVTNKSDHLWNIYPNPATEHLYIETTGNSSGYMAIEITDYTGRVIDRSEVTSINQIKLDVGHLPKGMYHVHLIENNKRMIKMIMLN